MAQTILHSFRMFAAGMATAFLSRKPRFAHALPSPQPLRREPDDVHSALDDILFGQARPDVDALSERVAGHARALTGLTDMLARLREVVTIAQPHAPILVDAAVTADVGRTPNWTAFDETLFDVPPPLAGDRPVSLLTAMVSGPEDDLLFDSKPAPLRIPTFAIMAAQAENSHGVRF